MRNPGQRRRLFLLLVLAAFACLPLSVSAQNGAEPWSTVATTGEADEASQPYVVYGASIATINTPSASIPRAASVVLRYNVAPVDGLFFSGCKLLKVRFRDDGQGASILVYLKRTNIDTGANANILTFASNNFAAATGFQTQVGNCVNHTFDFSRYNYWIEATMTRSVFGDNQLGNPALQAIQITTIVF